MGKGSFRYLCGKIQKPHERTITHLWTQQSVRTQQNPDNITIIGSEDHGLAKPIKEFYIYIYGSTTPHSIGMWVSITFIIYGTEFCLTPLSLQLIMTMGMHREHPSVGMLSSLQPIGMHIKL